MKKTLAAFACICAAVLVFASGDRPTSAQFAQGPVTQPNLVGKFCVYTTSPGNPQIYITDPVIVSIAGRPFFKTGAADSSDAKRFISLQHITEIVKLDDQASGPEAGEREQQD